MNENELASKLMSQVINYNSIYGKFEITALREQAAAILREQQANGLKLVEMLNEAGLKLKEARLEIEALKLGDRQWSHAMDLAKVEIAELKANREHDFGLGEASGFIKGHQVSTYKAVTDTKIEPTVVSYTHPAKEPTDDVAKYHYNKGHEDGRKFATVKELTDEDIRNIWASENGLEDMDMCKFDNFLQTFRFVEQAILRKAQEK